MFICRYEIDSAASPPCYRLTERGNEDKGDEERRVLAVFQKVLSVELRDAYLTTVIEQVRSQNNFVFLNILRN